MASPASSIPSVSAPPSSAGISIQRHDIVLAVKLRPLSDFPVEIARMRSKQKHRQSAGMSPIFKHRMQLMRGFPSTKDGDDLIRLLETELQHIQSPTEGPASTAGSAHERTSQLAAQQDDPIRTNASPSDASTSTSEPEPRVFDADGIGEHLEEKAKGCAYDELIQLMTPDTPYAMTKIGALHELLKAGQRTANPGDSADPYHTIESQRHPVVSCMAQLVLDVRSQQPKVKLATGLVKLLNASAAQLAGNTTTTYDKEVWLRGLPGQGAALFVCHGRAPPRNSEGLIFQRGRPDLVGLLAEREIPVGYLPEASAVATWIEVEKEASADLTSDLFQQIARYEIRNVVFNAAVGRAYGLTMCGPLLRLWLFDASGYTTSRAIDIMQPRDLEDLTLTLAFLTGPASQLVQRWQPLSGGDIICTVPRPPGPSVPSHCPSTSHSTSSDQAGPSDQSSSNDQLGYRVTFKDSPRALNDASSNGLFGRRTAVWGGEALIIESGCLRDGLFVRDEETPVRHSVNVIVKTSWLPSYLVEHEHNVLLRLQKAKVKDVPRSLGLLRLPTRDVPPWEPPPAYFQGVWRKSRGNELRA